MQVYSARYIDSIGEYETTIRNDGKTLRMKVRDVEFSGNTFDDFGINREDLSQQELNLFSLDKYGELCDCTIECEIPVLIIYEEHKDLEAKLTIKLELGKVTDNGWRDEDWAYLSLKYKGFQFHTKGNGGWLEDNLVDIQKQLPDGYSFKNCFGCAFSDYSVYGHSFFGDMLCFRNIKDKYRKVFDKSEFLKIMDYHTETVQETYLCPEFEIRKTGAGYRG